MEKIITEGTKVISDEERKAELLKLYHEKYQFDLDLRKGPRRSKEQKRICHYIYASSIFQVRLLNGTSIEELVEEIFDGKQMIEDCNSAWQYADFYLHALVDAYVRLATTGYEKDGIIYKRQDDSQNRIIRVYRKEMGKPNPKKR